MRRRFSRYRLYGVELRRTHRLPALQRRAADHGGMIPGPGLAMSVEQRVQSARSKCPADGARTRLCLAKQAMAACDF
jgi:hypothetical protein